MVPWLLAHPELDGSVAPCAPIDSAGVAPAVSRALTQQVFAPAVSGPDIDPQYYDAMLQASKAVCPHCHKIYPRGWKTHERACARRYNVASVQDAELPADLPAALRHDLKTGAEIEDELDDEDEADGFVLDEGAEALDELGLGEPLPPTSEAVSG
jgi:hypothetical protein